MIVFLVFFFIFLYVLIGAVVTYYLHYLYRDKACYKATDSWGLSTPEYCVLMGVFWIFTAPFAFALYYSRYGFPQSKGKR